MKALKTDERMSDQGQVRHLQKDPPLKSFWRWSGWHPVLVGMHLLAMLWLFIYSGPLLRFVDPSAASLDAGILSILLADLLIVHSFALSAALLVRIIRRMLTGGYPRAKLTKGFTQRLTTCLDTKTVAAFWGLLVLFCWVFWVLA